MCGIVSDAQILYGHWNIALVFCECTSGRLVSWKDLCVGSSDIAPPPSPAKHVGELTGS